MGLAEFGVLVLGVAPFLTVLGSLEFLIFLTLFGAAAAVRFPALADASAPPAATFLPFFVWRVFRATNPAAYLKRVPRNACWLIALILWAILSAFLLPRLLAGTVNILTIDRGVGGTSSSSPLRPVSGNITQTAYAIGDLLLFLATSEVLRNRHAHTRLIRAVRRVALLNCAFAFLNLAEYYIHVPPLLKYVRTGGYLLYDNYELGGFMRIQATFAESSHFANYTLPLFAFCFCYWLIEPRALLFGFLAIMLAVLLTASTSSTAYVGLGAYLLSFAMGHVFRSVSHGRIARHHVLLMSVLFMLALVVALVALSTQLGSAAFNYMDAVLFNKLQTSSGAERTAFNVSAWQNFIDTWGVGVGLGTARASSFVLVLLSNLGALGTFLFSGFAWSTFTPSHNPTDIVQRCSQQAVLAALLGATVSGFVFDLGPMFYIFAAAAGAKVSPKLS